MNMTRETIAELFVRAAEVERKLPHTEGPAASKAQNYGYVHDVADMNSWFAEDKRAANWAWLDPKNLRNTTNDVGIWYASMELIKLVSCEKKRRALWAWARAEAGGKAFSKWCRDVEGVSRQLGEWRRNAAILQITSALSRKVLQHNENAEIDPLPNQPEIGDKSSNIRVWRPEESKPACGFDEDLRDFSWAEEQNARRRQREQRKREAA